MICLLCLPLYIALFCYYWSWLHDMPCW